MNIELLDEIIDYIEYCEVMVDGEWGNCRKLSELIEQNVMPDIYAKLLALKENFNTNEIIEIWTKTD